MCIGLMKGVLEEPLAVRYPISEVYLWTRPAIRENQKQFEIQNENEVSSKPVRDPSRVINHTHLDPLHWDI
jgi:hypothetical protein